MKLYIITYPLLIYGNGVLAMSWVDEIVESVLRLRGGDLYVVASGITTSGPTHMGTIMEVLMPYTIAKRLRSIGRKAHFIFVADTMDSFDSIPAQLTHFKELSEFIGKPLSRVFDPYGCHRSYGHHYLDELVNLMSKLSIECDEVLVADELYSEGWYDDYARLFFSRLGDVRRILEETSFRKLPQDWMGIAKPICRRCGRIDKTVVLSYGNDVINYRCEACGYEGYVTIESHEWKLLWRLDWPSRQDFLGVDIEGGGVDHFTRGGSWDTAQAVHRELFLKEPPIGFKFGFVLFDGRKMSKSRGVGALSDIMKLLHPAVIKYFLLKHDLEENRNLRLDPRYLITLYDEYKLVGDGKYQDIKQLRAWELSGAMRWSISFSELLVYYQIYRDWGVIRELIKDDLVINELKPYVEEWIRRNLVPDEYNVQIRPTKPPSDLKELVIIFSNSLTDEMTDVDIHNKVYEIARSRGVRPDDLFKAIYTTILGKPKGPRLGRFIKVLGVRTFKDIVNTAVGN